MSEKSVLKDVESFVNAEMQRHSIQESLLYTPILNKIYGMMKTANGNCVPEPHQLTLDELRQMDGQPVWVNVLVDDYPGEWALASEFRKGATTATSVFQYDNYGVIWIAYDHQLGGDRQ